jgi:hypothetical protein
METQKLDIERKKESCSEVRDSGEEKKNFGTEIFPQLNPSIFASL